MYACGKEHLKGYFSLVRKSSFTYTSELGLYLSITKGTTAAQIIQTDLTEIVSYRNFTHQPSVGTAFSQT